MNRLEAKKVAFLVVGTQKGGTTALDNYLRLHSSIQMANVKEVHYFDNEGHHQNNVDHDIYHNFFEPDLNKMKGESTPIYMFWRKAMHRIYEYNPEMKIIAILRNPIERAYSHWNMERERGLDSESFSDAIKFEGMRCKQALPLQHRVYSYTQRGFYTQQINNIWRYFPKDQTLFLKSEDLKANLDNTLQKISSFLRVAPFSVLPKINSHSREYISKLNISDKEYLNELYFDEIKQLEKMLGWDCTDWLMP